MSQNYNYIREPSGGTYDADISEANQKSCQCLRDRYRIGSCKFDSVPLRMWHDVKTYASNISDSDSDSDSDSGLDVLIERQAKMSERLSASVFFSLAAVSGGSFLITEIPRQQNAAVRQTSHVLPLAVAKVP
jgi:hypothetical protein